ncbi:MlaE family lipid ABC transporter permease subunit [Phyllobacterium sp. 21LDTY02-6]|uniref:ABC transporter permease n=1 Tax=Phyllobacterium sp. 21LDTY02-6 TaxID=2944903 RepID=UPI00201FF7D6|nr:MlaE family lipid ABC transporter permease subunit [Phyllobacterium sp. 21LDTY02-6]MCO4316196.1 MlaE family lipid ABC transporter permease subunit [Phyllobacterium sp. 21LDTY02-6]
MLTDRASKSSASTAAPPQVEFSEDGGQALIALSGAWTTRNVRRVDDTMRQIGENRSFSSATIDLSGVELLDTAGTWLVERLRTTLEKAGKQVALKGQAPGWAALFEAVGEAASAPDEAVTVDRPSMLTRMFAGIGRGVYAFGDDFLKAMHILGATVRGAQMKGSGRTGIRPAAIVHQIDSMGIGAIPVVVLMSTIIGAIIAQQGAFQLRYFGAEIFVVDLVGILVLREIGVLLTAIMIAGRSGSAITAEIGSMKMREETDALTVIGLNPVGVLVFPRLVALVISLPLLTIIADFAALVGAIIITWAYSGISPDAFIQRLRDAVDLSSYLAGLIKAPFMAMIIGVMASVEGMKVGGSAESLGQRVTASVVKSIFVVIVVDGFFAIFYASINF